MFQGRGESIGLAARAGSPSMAAKMFARRARTLFASTRRAGGPVVRLVLTGVLVGIVFSPRAWAKASYKVNPTSINFGSISTSVKSLPSTIIITNTGTTTLTVTSFSLSPSEFQLTEGITMGFGPGQMAVYSVAFAPDAAQTFTGQLVVNIEGFSPLVIPLTGTGFITGAVPQVTPTTFSFGSQALGTTSAAQTFTVSNLGTTPMTVNSITGSSLYFTINAPAAATTLSPGQSLNFSATFSPTAPIAYTATVDISLDVVPDVGVSLSGTGAPATSLAVNTLATLPTAIQNASYLANLAAAGGTAPYTWQLSAGSALPAGLSLSSSGTISGSIASGVAVGNYTFTARVIDSGSPPATASEQLTLPVAAPTGANCNNIYWDVAGTTTPLVALTDLGTGTYFGVEGGLYPDGSNVDPSNHDASGVTLADSIQPLDANGNPDPNGKIALVSIGISSAQQQFDTFTSFADADALKNPHLVFVNGAQPSESTSLMSDPNSAYWSTLFTYLLPNSGVTANQVVAAWVEDVEPEPTGTFPTDMTALQSSVETLAQTLLIKFPNIKLAYLSSRIYTGYSNGIKTQNPEPYSYEFAFAARGAIEDQLNGDPALNFDPAVGPVVAPWLAWGPYYWTNGLLGRSDGLVWSCADSKSDGYHASDPSGRLKVVDPLLNFLKSNDSAAPWFLASTVPFVSLSPTILNFGDQNLNTTSPSQTITLTNTGGAALNITSIAASGDYAETNTCGTSVGVEANCTITVTFTPTVLGTDNGTLTITDNSSTSPQSVSLSGTGTDAVVTLSPLSLNFGTLLAGTTSAPQTITLTNSGTGILNITSISVTGADPHDFSQTNTCGTGVAAGASCTITVTFKPSTRNLRTASVTIADNAAGSPQAVTLSGIGTFVMLSPASLNFGSQAVGTTSAPQTVTMSNVSNLPITISTIRIVGANSGDFAETNTCGSSLAAKASCAITVTFTPTATGNRSAAAQISDGGGGSPQSAPLSGNGT